MNNNFFIASLLTLAPFIVTAEQTIEEVDVTSSYDAQPALSESLLNEQTLKAKQAGTTDTTRLLEDIPGMSIYGAGGTSSLPVIHGLGDDRIRIQIDGMDLMPACPNHMNSALSYIAPSKVGKITVHAGITPVSVGGDSLGGSIQVEPKPPEFARSNEGAFFKGEAGTYYRSNANARGYNYGLTWVGHNVNMSYSESNSQAGNYKAAKNFKPAVPGTEGGSVIPGDVVASSAFDAVKKQDISLAFQHKDHLLQFSAGVEKVGFEGFPNQRMDMTGNDNRLINMRYNGQYDWGDLEARIYNQATDHEMDMGPDRFTYGTGMPMMAEANTDGVTIKGEIMLSGDDVLRVGADYQSYSLNDYWPSVGGTMGPNAFWNIDQGQRDKFDLFAEWETFLNSAWYAQVGIRSTTIKTNAAPVQGYDNGLAGLWGDDAAAFNALDRKRTDYNWDLTAMARYSPGLTQTYEGGYARKSRAPNLYQRYVWSTNAMAAVMNNLVGDGNGYVGNVNLKPEVAHTLSLTGKWQGTDTKQWDFKITGYYTYIQDYMDAKRCNFGQCSEKNETDTSEFVILQYVNQNAQMYGVDLSGQKLLAETTDFGRFTLNGLVNYVRGKNLTTGDNLYNIMPLNLKLTLAQRLGSWNNAIEFQAVAAKSNISQVRNEIPTDRYELFNLRSSFEWKQYRLDLAVENLFNQFYSMPLGGAYVGQGNTMALNGIPYGTAVPGKGRSFNVTLNMNF